MHIHIRQRLSAAGTLARILLDKGVLTQAEFTSFASALNGDRVAVLAAILRDKGMLTNADLARIRDNSGESAQSTTASLVPAAAYPSAPPQGPAAQAPAERPATPPAITTASKYGATFYGTALLNASYDTSLTNIEDVPLFAGKQGSDPFGNDKSFAMTARQSAAR